MEVPTSEIVRTLDAIVPESFETDADRHEAMEAARRLLARLQTPYERTVTLTWSEPVMIAGIQTLQDLGVWKEWAEKHKLDGNTAQSLENIVNMCNVTVEPNLIRKNFIRCFGFSANKRNC